MTRTFSRRALLSIAGAASVGLTLSGCVGGAATPSGSTSSAPTTTLHLVGFAVPKEANNAIQAKFALRSSAPVGSR